MVKLFSLKSPDEWATTKQACRDTYVVTCFLPSTIRILCVLCVFLQRLLSLLLKQQRIWVLRHWKSRQTAPTPSKVKIHNCILV